MVRNQRIQVEGYTFFIVNVTFRRQHILLDNVDLFWKAIESAKSKMKFDLLAWVILPEHFHLLVYFEKGSISNILKSIKLSFSAHY